MPMLIDEDGQTRDAAFMLFFSEKLGAREPIVQSWVSLHN